ncbi:hypothetical protein [Ramlibacter aurantiacus]|uniref:hypothetical protein n=1 Tax=Ramlibacter aurantiacus TaxID=2801330 RepID=UPI001F19F476|nr:hypothetical protein [Ramlibacter aurantiacus]
MSLYAFCRPWTGGRNLVMGVALAAGLGLAGCGGGSGSAEPTLKLTEANYQAAIVHAKLVVEGIRGPSVLAVFGGRLEPTETKSAGPAALSGLRSLLERLYRMETGLVTKEHDEFRDFIKCESGSIRLVAESDRMRRFTATNCALDQSDEVLNGSIAMELITELSSGTGFAYQVMRADFEDLLVKTRDGSRLVNGDMQISAAGRSLMTVTGRQLKMRSVYRGRTRDAQLLNYRYGGSLDGLLVVQDDPDLGGTQSFRIQIEIAGEGDGTVILTGLASQVILPSGNESLLTPYLDAQGDGAFASLAPITFADLERLASPPQPLVVTDGNRETLIRRGQELADDLRLDRLLPLIEMALTQLANNGSGSVCNIAGTAWATGTVSSFTVEARDCLQYPGLIFNGRFGVVVTGVRPEEIDFAITLHRLLAKDTLPDSPVRTYGGVVRLSVKTTPGAESIILSSDSLEMSRLEGNPSLLTEFFLQGVQVLISQGAAGENLTVSANKVEMFDLLVQATPVWFGLTANNDEIRIQSGAQALVWQPPVASPAGWTQQPSIAIR